jgi:hypothetical protein
MIWISEVRDTAVKSESVYVSFYALEDYFSVNFLQCQWLQRIKNADFPPASASNNFFHKSHIKLGMYNADE